MKYFSAILVGMLFLAACQQEQQPKSESEQTTAEQQASAKNAEPAATPAETLPAAPENSAEQHDHQHDHAQADIKPGEKYREVEAQFECEQPVVIEFFAYHCPHCNTLEPAAEAWRKKNAGKVKFISVPTHLGNQQLGSMLLVHHAAKKLGVLEKTLPALFHRFHVEKKLFQSPEEAADFLAVQGADRAEALTALMDQEAMNVAIDEDFNMLAKYKITSVPQVLVNHKYLTNITAAGSPEAVFDVVDETLALAHNCTTK